MRHRVPAPEAIAAITTSGRDIWQRRGRRMIAVA